MKIDALIEEVKKYLEYEDNWDDEGSKGYQKETLDRVKTLLQEGYKYLDEKFKSYDIPEPGIMPGPDGSFDIMWEDKDFKFLANVPEDENEEITYYGEGGEGYVKGKFKILTPDVNNFFLTIYLKLDRIESI